MHEKGEITDEEFTYYKHNACPGCGACSFMGTASTMQVMAEATMWAVSTDAADSNMAKADVVLLGPQIRFQLAEMKKKAEKYNIPVEAIPSVDYGMCNGPKVLAFATNLINNNKQL